MSEIWTLYHGSDHIVDKPLYNFGKEDNDYGRGFYTTKIKEKADEWAVVNGGDNAVTNYYQIDIEGLKTVNLNDYGTIAWIAEIISHRGARGEASQLLADEIVYNYKIDTENADIIIGYRADDSYIDIIDHFLKNELSIEEVDRLFYKGELGQQVFIKSEKAFNSLHFYGYDNIENIKEMGENEVKARMEVSKFLNNRETQILINGYTPNGLTARDIISHSYTYDAQLKYYILDEKTIKYENNEYIEDNEDMER